MRHLTTKYEAIPHIINVRPRNHQKTYFYLFYRAKRAKTPIQPSQRDIHTSQKPWHALTHNNIPSLVGPNTDITSLENKDDIQNFLVRLKSKKMKNPHVVKKTKSKMTPYFYLYGTKKKVKHTFSSKILLTYLNLPYASSNHQIWSHSAHKRPRNHQKTVFFCYRAS